MIEAELDDGTILEFPDGTAPSVIDAAVRKHLFNASATRSTGPTAEQRRMGFRRPKPEGDDPLARGLDAISGYNVGGKVTDALAGTLSPEAAAAVGTGANFATEAVPMFLGGVAAKAATLPATMQNLGRHWMRSAVKPSSALPQAKVERAMETMLEKGIAPTVGGMKPLPERIKALDAKIDDILKSSDERVSTTAVANRLVDELHAAERQSLKAEDMAAIRKHWEAFVASHPENISVQMAHELKKGTYAKLGNRPYNALQPSADVANKDAASKALARGFKEEVATAVPATSPLLREQSDLANVLSVAGRRAATAENANPIGLGLLAPNLDRMALWMLDRSPWAKGILARELYTGAAPASLGRLGGGYYGILGGQQPRGGILSE